MPLGGVNRLSNVGVGVGVGVCSEKLVYHEVVKERCLCDSFLHQKFRKSHSHLHNNRPNRSIRIVK
jgi:hypothetical protein